jgi:transcriptional regulator with XRE-family HTH domain
MLSQQELADRAGVSLFTVQRIERGEGAVRQKTGRAVARALGVGVEDLLPKVQAPLPFQHEPSFEEMPSLEEIHAGAGLETHWLTMSEEEWRAAWGQVPSPRDAVLASFDLGDEYSAVLRRIGDLDPEMALPHRLINGPYKQALTRLIYGLQNAHSVGVAHGKIAVGDKLIDLVKVEGLEEEAKRRGHERFHGFMLAS